MGVFCLEQHGPQGEHHQTQETKGYSENAKKSTLWACFSRKRINRGLEKVIMDQESKPPRHKNALRLFQWTKRVEGNLQASVFTSEVRTSKTLTCRRRITKSTNARPDKRERRTLFRGITPRCDVGRSKIFSQASLESQFPCQMGGCLGKNFILARAKRSAKAPRRVL